MESRCRGLPTMSWPWSSTSVSACWSNCNILHQQPRCFPLCRSPLQWFRYIILLAAHVGLNYYYGKPNVSQYSQPNTGSAGDNLNMLYVPDVPRWRSPDATSTTVPILDHGGSTQTRWTNGCPPDICSSVQVPPVRPLWSGNVQLLRPAVRPPRRHGFTNTWMYMVIPITVGNSCTGRTLCAGCC